MKAFCLVVTAEIVKTILPERSDEGTDEQSECNRYPHF